jgi:glycosyl-4,4'-diaponeurosporenoate acyltransferase
MMPVFALPPVWAILLDFAAWLMINLAVSAWTLKMPHGWFEHDSWLYRTKGWEKGGQFWQTSLQVKTWKERLPDSGVRFGRGFAKKRLQTTDEHGLDEFIRESRRAELTHVLAAVPAVLFFLWNTPLAGWINVVFALAINAPCIIAQRYNRPRFIRIKARKAGLRQP